MAPNTKPPAGLVSAGAVAGLLSAGLAPNTNPLAGLASGAAPNLNPPAAGCEAVESGVAAASDGPNLNPVPPAAGLGPNEKPDPPAGLLASAGRSSFFTPGLRFSQAGHLRTSPGLVM